MIITKEIKTKEDFESIKKGDILICEFNRDVYEGPKKQYRFGSFIVAENKENTSEMILNRKWNIYFNYEMFINPELGISNLISCVLVSNQ